MKHSVFNFLSRSQRLLYDATKGLRATLYVTKYTPELKSILSKQSYLYKSILDWKS